jgi:hypothetical protein
MDMNTRYWLKTGELAWQECTQEQFVSAERSAGFRPKPGCGPVATGGFGSGDRRGRVTYGEITEAQYGNEPDFAKLANESRSPA